MNLQLKIRQFPTAYCEDGIRKRVRMVYTHDSFAENFSSYLRSDEFKFTDEERLGVLRVIKNQEAKSSGQTRPDASSSEESECGEDPKMRYSEKNRNITKKLFASLVKEHVQRIFPVLERYAAHKMPNYSIKEDAELLAGKANVPESLLKKWGVY